MEVRRVLFRSHADCVAHVEDPAAHGPAASVPPKPFDPELPIYLGGVEVVTAHQQARADNLLAVTLVRLPQFADPSAVEAMGFHSIGDGFLGHEHYLNEIGRAHV